MAFTINIKPMRRLPSLRELNLRPLSGFVRRIFRNFYLAGIAVFAFWMLFLDSNDLINQLRLRFKLSALKREKAFYQEKIEEVKADREQLLTDEEMLETYARERYMMKKPEEELYIIVEK